MSAWPSSSCTPRRSPLDSSRWVANEWRNICGCTCTPGPGGAPRCRPAAARRAPTSRRPPSANGTSAAGIAPQVRVALTSAGALDEPLSQRVDRIAADRHDARLVALAEHAHRAIRRGRWRRDPSPTSSLKRRPGRIEQFHDGLVARRQRIVDAKRRAAAPSDPHPGSAAGASWSCGARTSRAGFGPPRPRAAGIRRMSARRRQAPLDAARRRGPPACSAAAKARTWALSSGPPARESRAARKTAPASADRAGRRPPCVRSCAARAPECERTVRSNRARWRPQERSQRSISASARRSRARRCATEIRCSCRGGIAPRRSRRSPEIPSAPFGPNGVRAPPSRSRSSPCRTGNRAAHRGSGRSAACPPAAAIRRS